MDIAKCADHRCPSRGNCLRFTAPASPEQTYADFMRSWNELGCDHYIHVADRDKRNRQLSRVAT